MWASRPQADDVVSTAGNVPSVHVREYAKAARAAGKQKAEEAMPFAGKTKPVAVIHEGGNLADIAAWLEKLQSDRFVRGLVTFNLFLVCFCRYLR